MLKAAIVILNYNGRAHLQRFLPGVVSHAPENTRVIVADNASTDDSEQYVRENHPTVRWIGLDKNHGYAEGYNLALKEVEAEYFALLNSDV
ncbi:MAG TPA: glycosyltransferase, partial [Cryomorphaceae bacterium]|nr:glycosyltransferase [Cryomorphaceae bacterium]